LYQIALHKPDLWRAMKERELQLSREEERRELRERKQQLLAQSKPGASPSSSSSAAAAPALAPSSYVVSRPDPAMVRAAIGHSHVLQRLNGSGTPALAPFVNNSLTPTTPSRKPTSLS
jgi:hypothetical protein